MKLSALAVVLLALGIVLGLALRGTVFEAEAKPPSPGSQPVEEQNVDANGYIAVHEQGVADVNVVSMPSASGGGCYTNWNADTCASGWTAVETGLWTVIQGEGGYGGIICAAEKLADADTVRYPQAQVRAPVTGPDVHTINLEPCAICCK
jgi:hypothetical protein